ncbi:MAG: hypothetical protein WCT18_02310 [Patescibacteria group bacterium]
MEKKSDRFFNLLAGTRDFGKIEWLKSFFFISVMFGLFSMLVAMIDSLFTKTVIHLFDGSTIILVIMGSSLLTTIIFYKKATSVKKKLAYIPQKVKAENPFLSLYKIENGKLTPVPNCGYFVKNAPPEDPDYRHWDEKLFEFITIDLSWPKREITREVTHNNLRIKIRFWIQKPYEFVPSIELAKMLYETNKSLGQYVVEQTEENITTHNDLAIEDLIVQYLAGQMENEMEFRYRLNLFFCHSNKIPIVGKIHDLQFDHDWLEIRPIK